VCSSDLPFGQFMNKTMDPVLDAWKFGMTIIRPGHHVRNAIGDMSITYAAEGVQNSAKASVDATRIMAYRVGTKYDPMDYIAMLNRLAPQKTAKAEEALTTLSLKGNKKEQVTIGEIREVMEQKGMFPGFGVSEDILGEGKGKFAKVARAISLQNRFTEKVGGSVSQGRDHWARAQHFMQFIRNNSSKYATKDELYDAASRQVLKYHPEGSILSAWEAKYMRRTFPFYTWMRGILPGAIEASVKNPGRFMVAPKASYNLAVAMGLDPESLSNPFPEDQMFPSFILEDALGPQFQIDGNYIRSNPGIATLDLAGTFSGGLVEGLISSASPFYKLPFEINSQSQLSTGAPINDMSDYIDRQIPNISPLSNITGVSPSGTLANLFQGRLEADPQYQVSRGNKTDQDRLLSLINYLTGLGTQNLSQPNLINYAEIEKRNQALEEAKRAQGQ
jgi:hypothetical protein